VNKRSLPIGVWVILSGFLLIGDRVHLVHAQAVGYGDSVLQLGTNGYASLSDSQFQGFNYQASFSLEVAFNIEANAAGGRWPVLLGKKYSPPANDAGFALSINQGQFKTVGQQVCSVIADGSNRVALSSRSFQGIVHAVMTWDAQGKVLNLYMNGGIEGSVTNSVLTGSLASTQSLKLGGPSDYGQSLQRDILLARIWNRILKPTEVGVIWTNFSVFSQRALPGGFDRTALVSEWLMEGLADPTHLQDTKGGNPLQLQGSALLWQGNGALALQSPGNGATNVATAVTLKAAGGLASLAGNPTKPLQYYFEIDETNTFDSSALKRSGWQAGYGTWKPVLKPSAQYFWRVKVQDSAGLPAPSGFVATNRFATKGPSTWYVRPGVYAVFNHDTGNPVGTPGVYGQQDGTSYDNAWNGTFSILWGEGGVESGDTVFICGTHLYTASNDNFTAYQALNYISESGYSDQFPIVIRMDYPSDPGVLWGVCRNAINGGPTWNGPDINGVYWTSNLTYSADYWTDGTNVLVLDRQNSTTWTNDLAASFVTNGVWYVSTPGQTNPSAGVCTSGLGYRFHLGRSSYIHFLNCRFRNAAPGMDLSNLDPTRDTQTALPLSSFIIFDGCDLRYNSEITPTPGNDHWTISNSELAFSKYGIYTFLNSRALGANYLTVRSNYIHDMGTPRFPHQDAHGVGIQGGTGHLIEGNHIEDTGSAIEFWTYSQPMSNHIVRYNFIKNIHVMPVTAGDGIVISGDNIVSVAGLRTGFKIYGNIIMNTGLGASEVYQGAGIGSNNKDYMEVFNNTVYNATVGIHLSVVNGASQGKIENNIVAQATGANMIYVAGDVSTTNLTVDYNLYYPVTNASNQIVVYSNQPHDQHSVFGNPRFISGAPSTARDFRLGIGSRAIGAGTPVGIPYDFNGTPIPINSPPDIGAFQFLSTTLGPLPPSDLHVLGASN
jgi:hypothetical protein